MIIVLTYPLSMSLHGNASSNGHIFLCPASSCSFVTGCLLYTDASEVTVNSAPGTSESNWKRQVFRGRLPLERVCVPGQEGMLLSCPLSLNSHLICACQDLCSQCDTSQKSSVTAGELLSGPSSSDFCLFEALFWWTFFVTMCTSKTVPFIALRFYRVAKV